MAEYTDITKTGPLSGKQIAQLSKSLLYKIAEESKRKKAKGTQYVVLTDEEKEASDKYYQDYREAIRPKYTPPKGTQTNNNYPISTEAERKKWWEEEGRKKYGYKFGDASIKKGYFNDMELEGVYRDMLFEKEFSGLPEYKELLKLKPNERDSYYAYWRGRVNAPLTYEADGKKYPVPFMMSPDNFENNPEGREAGRILADLNYYFGQNFDNWTNEERKQFYNEWDVKKQGGAKFNQALQANPNLKPKEFKTQQEVDDFLKNAYARDNAAKVGREDIKTSSNPMSVNNPANMDSFIRVNNVISDSDATRVEKPWTPFSTASKEDIQRWRTQAEYEYEHKDEIAAKKEEKAKRLEQFEQEWYRQNPIHHFWQTGTEEHPFSSRKKMAKAYAQEQEMLYNMTDNERKEYDAKQKRLEVFQQEYKDLYPTTPFFRFDANNKLRFGLDASTNAAYYYAQERNAVWERQNATIPQDQNPFALGITQSDLPSIVANTSGLYQEFNGSDWMPQNEIPWNDIYDKTKNLWESGHIEEAIYQTDRILEDLISDHQGFVGRDNLGHASEMGAAWKNFYSMGVESLVEGATFLPSVVVGLGQAAFNPNELQTESGMNFFDRALDNAIHNDWLGIASNQRASDWASEIMENNVIYGNDIKEQILSGAGTAGAQVGNLLMFAAGGLEARAARALMKDAAKAAERVAKKEIVDAGKLASYNMRINKTVDNLNLFKANYGEAMQQSLEGERQIYAKGKEDKKELIKKYRPQEEYITVGDGINARQTIAPFEAHFTQEELEEALDLQPNAEAWKAYLSAIQNGQAAVPPEEGVSAEEFIDRVRRDAEGLHRLYQEIPDFNDNVALNAKLKANTDLVTQTALLFGFDRFFGGLDKFGLDLARGRKALKPKDLVNKIKGLKIGDLKPNTNWLKGAWTVAQNPVMEAITEVGQQTGSALTKQIAEHNIDSFLENQLYGNGLQSWAATTYEGLYNLDWEEFGRDADIKRTLTQTLLTTPLMPVLGGYRNRTARGQNQSWVSRALENIHYYSPIKTTIGEQLYNIGQHNKQVQAAVDYINRWGADPVNQANTRGLIGVQNYTEKMIADLINNDEVAYNNDVFSRTLSEAIMLSNTRETPFAQNRLQWLTNMSQIKSATNEQKAAAIQSMRQEAAGNSAVRNLSDEQLLDLMETSSKKVLDTYNKVNEIVASDERFTDGTYNWQQQSAILFNRMAREDLQHRIADKEARIQAAIQSLGEIDLGESKTSKDKVEEGKTKDKKVLLSGRDILNLSPFKRSYMLSPAHLNDYSDAQQRIIKETINALNQVDGNVLNDIANAGEEEKLLNRIEKDYTISLQTPNWQSKRVRNKAEKIKKAFTTEGNAKAFRDRVSQAQSVAEVYNAIVTEREANATRNDESAINIEDILDSAQDANLKQKIDEARKLERIVNSIKSKIAASNLSDDIKDDLFNQVDKIASEVTSATEMTDISNYSIPVLPDGRDISGDLSTILQTAVQQAATAQTVNSEPIKKAEGTDNIPSPTNLGNRDVDTGNPVNDTPLKRYTLEEAREKLKELNESIIAANDATDDFQHTNLLIKSSALQADLESRVPSGYTLQLNSNSPTLEYQLVKSPTQTPQAPAQSDTKNDDLEDINNREQGSKEPIDRDGITKVAEIQFEEGGKVYSYPVRDEDVQLGDGVSNTVGSNTGRVINIRDVQDDAEAEFLIYQTNKDGNFKTDEQGNRIKRDRPSFIDRHTGALPKETKNVVYEDDKRLNTVDVTTNDGVTTYKVKSFNKEKQKYFTKGLTPIEEDILSDESKEQLSEGIGVDVTHINLYISEVKVSGNKIIGEVTVVNYHADKSTTRYDATYTLNTNPLDTENIEPNKPPVPPIDNPPVEGSTEGKVVLNLDGVSRKGTPLTSRYIQTIDDDGFIHIKHEGAPTYRLKVKSSDLQSSLDDLIGKREDFQTEEGYNEVLEDAQGKGLSIVQITIRPDGTVSIRTDNGITIDGSAAKEILNKYFYNQQSPTSPTENSPITGPTGNNRYSNRTEYQQSVVDNNITPTVTELDGTALSKGQFEPNKATGQPNVMRQLQEEGAFDYINKGALTEGDEIEFVVSQEQMPDGSNQVVIWEVTEPKDGVERTNPKWHGKQLLNVLDQTEIGGKRKELIDRIRKAYEEARRPESFLYNTETFTVDKISHSIVPFKQTNPTEASSDETIETTNLQKGLTKQNGTWGISFFNKTKGRMVHVPIIFRQAKKVRNGATKILFSDKRMESKTIDVQKTNVGKTGDVTDITMVIPTPNGFVSAVSVYVVTKDLPDSNEKYKESITSGSVGKALIEKIKSHLKDIKTVSAFSDYLGFRRGYSEYIYNDRSHGRIDLGYRGSTGNTTLISAVPQNGKYILVDPTDARNILNDNNGQGFTLDEVCKEYLTQLVDNPEADVTMRLNMEAIESKPEIITDLIDDGLLWAPNSLNARFTAANTQFSCSLDSEAKPSKPKKETLRQEPQQPKETPKPAPVASSNNPSSTTEPVKKTQPKVDDSVELGSKVKRRKLKAGQSAQVRPEAPTTPISTTTTTPTSTSGTRTFETLSEKDKQHILTKVTKEEWDNLTKEEQDNILNC